MKDAEDEYEKAEKLLQEQLFETKEQLSAAQRVLLEFYLSVLVIWLFNSVSLPVLGTVYSWRIGVGVISALT